MHKVNEKAWTLKRGVEHAQEILGTELVHYYEAPPSEASPEFGDAMPDRPTSGPGALAVVTHVHRRTAPGRAVEVLEIVGFEAEGWA
jgi:hypothetical protein